MISALVSVFKYSALVLVILVLSHIVQIKGVTISQHVENGMSWVSGGHSHSNFSSITRQFSSAVHHDTKEDADGISHADKQELDTVIKKSSHHR